MINIKRAKLFCKEDPSLIENYDKAINDKTQTWHIHHRLEVQEDGTHVLAKELEEQGLLYNRPACELIFLTPTDHKKLHNIGNTYFLGKKHSDETRQKMKDHHKGMLGKKHLDETKRKMGEARKGNTNRLGKHHTKEAKQKIREGNIGKKRSEATKQKMREARKKYWENKKKNIDKHVYGQ